MSRIMLDPDKDTLSKWGELAYVTETERRRILALPFRQFTPEIERLKKEIRIAKKNPALAKRFFDEGNI
jgi:hypothetical protein